MEDDAFEDEQRRQHWFIRLLVFILRVVHLLVYVAVIFAWNFVAWVFMAFAQVLFKCATYVTCKAMEVPGLVRHIVCDRIWTALASVVLTSYQLICAMVESASNFVACAFVAFAKVLNKCATYVTCIGHLRTRAKLKAKLHRVLHLALLYVLSEVFILNEDDMELMGLMPWVVWIRNTRVRFSEEPPVVHEVPRNEEWEEQPGK